MTIEALLDPGEKLLWSGRPHAGEFAARKGLWPFFFGLFFSSLAAWTAYGSYEKGGVGFLFSIGFVAVGVFTTLTPVSKLYEARHTTYALTNRRVVTDVAGFNPFRRSVPLQQIRFIEVRPSDRIVGHVFFQDLAESGGESSWLTREGFVAIPDAENVGRLLRRAIESLPDNRLNAAAS